MAKSIRARVATAARGRFATACERAHAHDARGGVGGGCLDVDSSVNQNAAPESVRGPRLRREIVAARSFPHDGSSFALNHHTPVPTRFDNSTPKERPM
ncbi:hypothetical protein WS70_27535 [Burkholderia mayonis]|uniref:Uncharacterized protein n=1 Tax=Burkholderia mayonis TaxID=1385591 RepID=A0A1B4FP53_9BURK|nr:hypothetical protein WS70_27535 [Burkholderia mayonis]KVE38049.1 hypothetical protein WS69_09610 [Burkholderia sp. BDU5]KVE47847.1 hypothetical protein WS70_25225 [Burkholderia mayonis]